MGFTVPSIQSNKGYSIQYYNPLSPNIYTPVNFKLLNTDYINFASICGYTDASNSSTQFGLILSRNQYPNKTELNQWEYEESLKFANISNSSMSTVYQNVRYDGKQLIENLKFNVV